MGWLRSLFKRSSPASPSELSSENWRQALGQRGEAAAIRELQKRGYRILAQNYLCHGGEIDIIAEHRDTLIFAEVKTRSSRAWGEPHQAITPEKQSRVQRAARHYLLGFNKPSPTRFDAISVITDEHGNVKDIEILTNAFGLEESI